MNTTTRYRDHTIVGTPAELANVLVNHTRAGTLVAATAPRPTADGRCRVTLRLRRAPNAIRTGPLRRTRRIVALALIITGGVVSVLTAVAYLLGQLVELITAHAAAITGVLVLAVAILAALTRAGICPGIHCPGCSHR